MVKPQTKEVTLTCSNHNEMLVAGLWGAFKAHKNVDLYLMECDERPLVAHKIVADVFLSSAKLQGGALGDLPIPDVDLIGHAEHLLEFMYTGRVTVGYKELDGLLEVAEELEFRVLADTVRSAMSDLANTCEMKKSKASASLDVKKDSSATSTLVSQSRKRQGAEVRQPSKTTTARINVGSPVAGKKYAVKSKDLRLLANRTKKKAKLDAIVQPNDPSDLPPLLERQRKKVFKCGHCDYSSLDMKETVGHLKTSHMKSSQFAKIPLLPTNGTPHETPDGATEPSPSVDDNLVIMDDVRAGHSSQLTAPLGKLPMTSGAVIDGATEEPSVPAERNSTGDIEYFIEASKDSRSIVVDVDHNYASGNLPIGMALPATLTSPVLYSVDGEIQDIGAAEEDAENNEMVDTISQEQCSTTSLEMKPMDSNYGAQVNENATVVAAKPSLTKRHLRRVRSGAVSIPGLRRPKSEKNVDGDSVRPDSVPSKARAKTFRLTCVDCKLECGDSAQLKAHRLKHTFQCWLCDFSSSQKGQVGAHYNRVHLRVRRFVCEICGYATYGRNNLDLHQRRHTGEKPYACKVCSKAFTDMSTMLRHAKRHSSANFRPVHRRSTRDPPRQRLRTRIRTDHLVSDTPIKCIHCDFTADRQFLVNKHVRAMHGLRAHAYACDVCEYTGFTNDDVKKHRRKHTGEKPFVCSGCNDRFRDRGTYRRHTLRYCYPGRERPFSCPSCDRAFTLLRLLKKHMKGEHGKSLDEPAKKEEGAVAAMAIKEEEEEEGAVAAMAITEEAEEVGGFEAILCEVDGQEQLMMKFQIIIEDDLLGVQASVTDEVDMT